MKPQFIPSGKYALCNVKRVFTYLEIDLEERVT